MGLGTVLGVICIVMAFIAALVDEDLIFNPLGWLVAAIAFAVTLGGVVFPFGRRPS